MSSTRSSTSKADASHHSLHRDLGLIGLLFASVGSIIGSGWLFGAMSAATETGPSAWIAWVIGGVMILAIALVYAELGSLFPIAGGVVRFPHLAFGSFASYTAGWSTWIAASTTAAIEVTGALQYATKYAHFTTQHTVNGEAVYTLTPLGMVIAVLLLALFVVINYIGVSWFAKVNNVLVWWKLGMIVLVIVAFVLTRFQGSNFSSHGFMTHGWPGIFAAVASSGIIFSFLGFRQAIELAGEGSNPKRDIPIAVVGSVLLTGLLYVLLQVAFIGALDPGTFAKGWDNLDFGGSFGPLAAIASALGLGWVATLLYIDAVLSPADTGLIYTTTSSRLSYAMARNKNAPQALARTTRRGAPVISLILTFVVALLALLPFPSWQQLVGFITAATVISFGSGPLVLGALRRRLPDAPRSFRVPGGDVIPVLAFVFGNLIIIWEGWTTDWKLFVAILIGFVLLAVHETVGRETAPIDFRSGGAWVITWLVGLAVLSYLGPADFDGKDVLGFWTTAGLTVVLSAVVYVIAMRQALPQERIREHVTEAERDSEEEERAFHAH